ncbi:MAG TPA: hypothetical protein VGG19_08210, partial [Tepidisphaeraceae bacterium]
NDWPGSASPLPDVFYTNESPTVYTGSFNSYPPGAFSSAFPAFVVAAPEPSVSIGRISYSTGAMDSLGNLYEGTVSFTTYELDVIEQPVPEPSVLGITIGLAIIAPRRKCTAQTT